MIIYNILDNGIKSLILPIKNKNLVYIECRFKCGFNNEKVGINNYSHLLEHLIATFFHKDNCSIDSIRNEINKRVFFSNAYTDKNETVYWIKCYKKDSDFFIGLLGNTVFETCFEKKSLKIAKLNVIKELEEDEENEFDVDYERFINGKKKVSNKYGIIDIKKLTEKDIVNFHKKILNKDIIISVNCHKNHINNIKTSINKYFNRKIEKVKNDLDYNPVLINLKNNKIIEHHNHLNNSILVKIVIPISLNYYSKKYIALKIILSYLFNFEYGILYKILRHEKKLIYSINYEFDIDYYNSHKTNIIITTYSKKSTLNTFLKEFMYILKNFEMNYDMFKLFKNESLFILEKNKKNKDSILNNYYTTMFLYNIKFISYTNYIKSIKNIEYKTILKYKKQFQELKYITFLYNKSYKKQID
jgi:predicted Zn-dependent peptidase